MTCAQKGCRKKKCQLDARANLWASHMKGGCFWHQFHSSGTNGLNPVFLYSETFLKRARERKRGSHCESMRAPLINLDGFNSLLLTTNSSCRFPWMRSPNCFLSGDARRNGDDGDVFESPVRLKAGDQFLNKAAHEFRGVRMRLSEALKPDSVKQKHICNFSKGKTSTA